MELTNDHVAEMWEIFSDIIATDKKNDAALRFIEYLQQNDYDSTDLPKLRGRDDHIDFALDQLSIDEDDEFMNVDDSDDF